MTEKISLPHPLTVSRWKEEKVIKWLKRVNLEDCIPAFEIRRIDGPKLLELTEQKLFTYQDLKIKYRNIHCIIRKLSIKVMHNTIKGYPSCQETQ
ncbi:uncharacterized protein TNCT_69741 [Trichonephila clavata]|uniref:SAM domain-containing protein n=1 Tax=Trichonephila clavata TaxID=2740835 RepID=A0A8X6LWT9_TRICU|nr:uncharacterized protein TNCT_69741 [Trichonephila clavata]